MVKDEEDRLADALDSVAWADEIVVVDTGSKDGTRELARTMGARVVEIPWEGYVASRNRALSHASHDWVLALDADERVPTELAIAIRSALRDDAAAGERLAGLVSPRLSRLFGRPVRHGTWYPDRKLRLGRRSRGFSASGGRVHETLTVDGPTAFLAEPLLHDPYRDLRDLLRKAVDYARLASEDRYENGRRAGMGSFAIRPLTEFLRCYVAKLGFLDGRIGLLVASLHGFSYLLRAAFLWEKTQPHKPPNRPDRNAAILQEVSR